MSDLQQVAQAIDALALQSKQIAQLLTTTGKNLTGMQNRVAGMRNAGINTSRVSGAIGSSHSSIIQAARQVDQTAALCNKMSKHLAKQGGGGVAGHNASGGLESVFTASERVLAAQVDQGNPLDSSRTCPEPDKIGSYVGIPKLPLPLNPKDILDGVNPNYGQPGYSDNCQRCIYALYLRSLGYDVSAMAYGEDGSSNEDIWGMWMPGVISELEDNRRDFLKDAQPEDKQSHMNHCTKNWKLGDKGILEFERSGAPGHVINIEMTSNGIVVQDGQNKYTNDLYTYLSSYGNEMHMVSCAKLSGKELSPEGLCNAVGWWGKS